jgi:hypothetical protein
LQHELMKETKDYLDRGRRFAELSSAEIVERCITAVKLFVERHVGSHVTDMDDAYAELRLRGLNLPKGAIRAEIEIMRAEIERGGPEAPPGLREKLEAFRAECDKPKH